MSFAHTFVYRLSTEELKQLWRNAIDLGYPDQKTWTYNETKKAVQWLMDQKIKTAIANLRGEDA